MSTLDEAEAALHRAAWALKDKTGGPTARALSEAARVFVRAEQAAQRLQNVREGRHACGLPASAACDECGECMRWIGPKPSDLACRLQHSPRGDR